MTTELPIPTPNGFDSVIALRNPAWAHFLPSGVQLQILGERGTVVDWSMASEADIPEEMSPQDVLKASTVLRLLIWQAIRMGGLSDRVKTAWFVVTTDPAIVKEYGEAHDCPRCRAGTDQALARLREHPDDPLLVGILAF